MNLEFAKSYRNRSVLVTGASGFVGRWVCRLLSDAGANLWMVSRDPAKLEAVCREYQIVGQGVEADLFIPGEFSKVVNKCHPSITFNAAGYGIDPTERDAALRDRINSDLPGEIVRTLAFAPRDPTWHGQDLVHTGTAFEYGPLQGMIDESTVPQPSTPYGRSKLGAVKQVEQVCRDGTLRAILARLCTVYGPGEYAMRLLPTLLRAAADGVTIDLTEGKQKRDFTFVQDVAEGLLRLGTIDCAGCTTVNLCTGNLISVQHFIRTAQKALDLAPNQLRFGALPGRADEVHQGSLSTRHMQTLTGWVPNIDPPAGIARTRAFLDSPERGFS